MEHIQAFELMWSKTGGWKWTHAASSFTVWGLFLCWIRNVPTSHSSWELSVLCSCNSLRSLPKSLHQLYKPRDGGERGENYFYGFFFLVREENKRLLTWWPMTDYDLLLPQELKRGLAFPMLPLLLLPSIGIFFKPCFRWKCKSLAWMNTDIDLSKLLSHFKLGDS